MTDSGIRKRKSLRSFAAVVRVTYLGGSLPADTQAALTSALRRRAGDLISELEVDKLPGVYETAYITAVVRAGTPVEAIDALVRAVDGSMLDTGVFEEFDATGKVLQVAPLEIAQKSDLFRHPA
jgi:hypothetical protein